MIYAHKALALAILVGSAVAKQCTNTTVPVDIYARNGVFDIAIPQTNLDTTTFTQNVTRQGQNSSDVALSGHATNFRHIQYKCTILCTKCQQRNQPYGLDSDAWGWVW